MYNNSIIHFEIVLCFPVKDCHIGLRIIMLSNPLIKSSSIFASPPPPLITFPRTTHFIPLYSSPIAYSSAPNSILNLLVYSSFNSATRVSSSAFFIAKSCPSSGCYSGPQIGVRRPEMHQVAADALIVRLVHAW